MKLLLVLLLLAIPVAGWGAEGKLVGKDVIFDTVDNAGVPYSVKSTNIIGTYFWYYGGIRCVASFKKTVLDVACKKNSFEIYEDSGDVFLKFVGAQAAVLQDVTIGYDMYESIKTHAHKK
jgi:hypothetical protein